MTREIFRDHESKEYYLEPLISPEQIQSRVRELGQEITRDYQGQEVILIGVLRGAHMFLSDLEREIKLPGLQIDFVNISSYENGTSSSRMPRLIKDVETNVKGKHVIFVEDIVDTGYSLETLLKIFEARGALSVETAALLSKPERREVEIPVKYTGFEIPNTFVVGYGLDYRQKHRELPGIAAVNFIP